MDDGARRPRQFPGVVVSSSFVDFREHRAALIEAINGQALHPIAMEHDAALPAGTVIDSSLGKVREATAYVGIIGVRYGQVPDSPELNPDQVSLTELEFREARRLGLPILLFVMGDDHPVKARDVEGDPQKRAKLDAFREDAKRAAGDSSVHRVYADFDSLGEFEVKATQSVAELRRHIDARPPDRSRPEPVVDNGIPAPPALYAEPRYIGSHTFVGRAAQLTTLSDWASPADPHPVLLFEAIGGTGKSMLTWEWTTRHATGAHPDWAGRFWYSFYERGAVMADFCRRALAYMTGKPLEAFEHKRQPELTTLLLNQLQARPWLLVLDGLERILVAYHRFDAAQLRDERAGLTDEIAQRDPSTAIRPLDDELLRQLAGAAPSKVLITSRLLPRILLNSSSQPIPGVQHERLPGLRPGDAEALIRACGVQGESQVIQDYLQRHCDCHPLVTGVLAGLVNGYLPARGDFDAWAADTSAGGHLNLGDLDLVQKRNHILTAAFDALPPASRRLLQTLSFLDESFDYEILVGLNPGLPPAEPRPAPADPSNDPSWDSLSLEEQEDRQDEHENELMAHDAAERESWRARHRDPAVLSALSRTVTDLERRGLVQYDKSSKLYDLHPVVRAVAAAALGDQDRSDLGQHVVDLFSSRAPNYDTASSMDELRDGLTAVRALLQMGRVGDAHKIWAKLDDVLFQKLEAYADNLALCRPFFKVAWSVPSDYINKSDASILATSVSMSLRGIGEFGGAIEADELGLRLDLQGFEDWVVVDLANLAKGFMAVNELALADRAAKLTVSTVTTSTWNHISLEALFLVHTCLGRWSAAEEIWNSLGKERGALDGERNVAYVQSFLRPLGRLAEDDLAPPKDVQPSRRWVARGLRAALGEWRLSRGEDGLAIEPLQDAVHMAREVGLTDPTSEALLALARYRLGDLPDAAAEADRLSSVRHPDHIALAQLWMAVGNPERAIQHATEAYRWAWADGEPYVRRYELTQAEGLLRELGAAMPVLPPYDPAKHPIELWEREVEAFIERIRNRPDDEPIDE